MYFRWPWSWEIAKNQVVNILECTFVYSLSNFKLINLYLFVTEAPVAVDCTPRPDIQPRNITMARLSNLRLFLTWSDCGMSYADLMDEGDCIFTGKMMGDPSSSALVTGCEDEDIDVQIHSKVFGDWLFPTKDGVVQPLYGDDEPDYEYYPDYIDDGSFDEQFPVLAEANQRI